MECAGGGGHPHLDLSEHSTAGLLGFDFSIFIVARSGGGSRARAALANINGSLRFSARHEALAQSLQAR